MSPMDVNNLQVFNNPPFCTNTSFNGVHLQLFIHSLTTPLLLTYFAHHMPRTHHFSQPYCISGLLTVTTAVAGTNIN